MLTAGKMSDSGDMAQVGRVLAVWTWGPELEPSEHREKLCMAVHPLIIRGQRRVKSKESIQTKLWNQRLRRESGEPWTEE